MIRGGVEVNKSRDGAFAHSASEALLRGERSAGLYATMIAGMTLKEYDRYLHLRSVFPPAHARALAMGRRQ